MPEGRKSRHPGVLAKAPRLSTANEFGALIRVRCQGCRTRRHYRPLDLIAVFDNIPVLDLAPRFRCQKCSSAEFVQAEIWLPWPNEWPGLEIRELVRVDTVRRPVWKDVKM
ncbi:hypothetical protein [Rhizobium rhizosphaerae]|uniref:hypothetical protein n=1 Tax=Xaviernesmea rhizosphaerae TaxID=1672749 RepID=UPI0015939788|nr:hypothetical protein [Xaviernesmea rhizosphaerae]